MGEPVQNSGALVMIALLVSTPAAANDVRLAFLEEHISDPTWQAACVYYLESLKQVQGLIELGDESQPGLLLGDPLALGLALLGLARRRLRACRTRSRLSEAWRVSRRRITPALR